MLADAELGAAGDIELTDARANEAAMAHSASEAAVAPSASEAAPLLVRSSRRSLMDDASAAPKGDVELLVTYGGVFVLPASLFMTFFMIIVTQCFVDQCTFDVDPLGNYAMQVALAVFHAWLWIVVGVLYAAKHKPKVKQALLQRIPMPFSLLFFPSYDMPTVAAGHIYLGVGIILLLIFNQVWWYFIFQYEWQNNTLYVSLQNTTEYRQPYQVAQQFGRVNEILLGLAMIPVSRNSVLDSILGLSYIDAMKFHRIIGWFLVLSVAIHGSAACYSFTQNPLQSYQSMMFNFYDARMAVPMAEMNQSYLQWGLGMYMNEMGAIAGMIMVVPIVLSFPPVRRRAYGIFANFHLLLHVSIIFAWLHATSNFYYMMPALGLFLIDMAARAYCRLWPTRVLKARQEPAGLVRIDFACNRPELRKHSALQFVRVCVPAVTGWQWHPFTIVSDSQSDSISVLMSTTHDKDWAGQIAKHVLTHQNSVEAVVDGPFSADEFGFLPLSEGTGTTLLLIGGAGISTALSLVEAAPPSSQERYVVVWSVRGGNGDPAALSLFNRLRNPRITVVVRETKGSPEPGLGDGRVDFAATLAEHAPTSVFVSGPGGFVEDALSAVHTYERNNKKHINLGLGSFEL